MLSSTGGSRASTENKASASTPLQNLFDLHLLPIREVKVEQLDGLVCNVDLTRDEQEVVPFLDFDHLGPVRIDDEVKEFIEEFEDIPIGPPHNGICTPSDFQPAFDIPNSPDDASLTAACSKA